MYEMECPKCGEEFEAECWEDDECPNEGCDATFYWELTGSTDDPSFYPIWE